MGKRRKELAVPNSAFALRLSPFALARVQGQKFLVLLVLLCVTLMGVAAFADQLLLTLSVQSSKVRWQDDFVLTLEIYGAPSAQPPDVTIDGMDQFQLKSIGKNLLQVPLGKTAKWILTYNLTAHQDGTFKLGPAAATVDGRRFVSNTLFITVEAPVQTQPRPAPSAPVIHSAAEIGEKVKVVMEAAKTKLYRSESVTVTLRLLSQLPVENLRFKEEADFPGFLKYDFPFSTQPKARWVTIDKQKFASYELQKFLVFPLKPGKLSIPAVNCELRVRPPSGAYSAADLILNVDRASNALELQVMPAPPSVIVGNFVLKNHIVSDEPREKVVRIELEGFGQLTTFDFPDVSGAGYEVELRNSATTSALLDEKLKSKKIAELGISPVARTTSIVLPSVNIRQFDPASGRISVLTLPELPLRFLPPGVAKKQAGPLPQTEDNAFQIALLVLTASSCVLFFIMLRPEKPKSKRPKLTHLFQRKNPALQISKAAAQKLYRQIMQEIGTRDGKAVSLLETVKQHLPETEWIYMERAVRKLESLAFSPSKEGSLTYRDMKSICERLERQWQI